MYIVYEEWYTGRCNLKKNWLRFRNFHYQTKTTACFVCATVHFQLSPKVFLIFITHENITKLPLTGIKLAFFLTFYCRCEFCYIVLISGRVSLSHVYSVRHFDESKGWPGNKSVGANRSSKSNRQRKFSKSEMTNGPSEVRYNRMIFAVIKVNCTNTTLQRNLIQDISGLDLGFLNAFVKQAFIFIDSLWRI